MSNDITFAFFGTPDISVTILDELEEEDLLPSLVVTNPDRARGRGQEIQPPPVKIWANERDIDVIQPESIDNDVINTLKSSGSYDLFVVAAYGKILPKKLLDIPEHGSLNVHPSLLPKQRGAAPIRGAILEENETGVSIMLMDEKLDHGPILAQEKVTSWSKDSGGPPKAAELEETLAHAGGKLLARVMRQWTAGEIEPTPQDHDAATYTGKFEKSDGEVDLEEDDPYEIYRTYAAFHRWPRTYFFTDEGTRVIISDAEFKDNKLNIKRVTPEGKQEMEYDDFKKQLK